MYECLKLRLKYMWKLPFFIKFPVISGYIDYFNIDKRTTKSQISNLSSRLSGPPNELRKSVANKKSRLSLWIDILLEDEVRLTKLIIITNNNHLKIKCVLFKYKTKQHDSKRPTHSLSNPDVGAPWAMWTTFWGSNFYHNAKHLRLEALPEKIYISGIYFQALSAIMAFFRMTNLNSGGFIGWRVKTTVHENQ